jgi:hypothetical protein
MKSVFYPKIKTITYEQIDTKNHREYPSKSKASTDKKIVGQRGLQETKTIGGCQVPKTS